MTPTETFTTDNSSFGELLVFNSVGTQIARVGVESFFSSVYCIFISGGGVYRFQKSGLLKPKWTCEGEGRTLQVIGDIERWFEMKNRFLVSEGTQRIAEFSRVPFSNTYEVSLIEDDDWKLIMGIVIGLSMSERSSADVPM